MSNWNGKAGKGAMRALRTAKREEAEARQASFNADVARVMREQNVSDPVARQIVQRDRLVRRG